MTSPAATASKRVALAAVAGAHGIKGEVRLKLFAEDIASLKAHDTVFIGGELRRNPELRDDY
jgi:16S rRNA processing protein RimM